LPILGRPGLLGSPLGRRYAHGHFDERDRHLVVSAGLGCSAIPVRFDMPPEVVVVDIVARPPTV
jgi:predicted MPP superfamily phosphohydrolase